MQSGIKLVPEDLLVRVVKKLKDDGDGNLLRGIEALEKAPSKILDKELVRRMILISNLPSEGLTNRDKVWLLEMAKVQKALLGVWQAKVMPEAIVAYWVDLSVKGGVREDTAKLYVSSLAELIYEEEMFAWLVRLMEEATKAR